MKSVTITVEILNWDKYNPRKDVTKPSWFRLENSLVDGPTFFDFTHEEFKSWLYILSHSSRRYESIVVVSLEHAKSAARIKPAAFLSAIKKLEALQTIKVIRDESDLPLIRNVDVAPAYATNETNERTNETRQDGGAADLLKIWNQHRGSLSEARGCTGDRRKHAVARWGEEPSFEYWTKIVQRLARSSFCQGKNDRGWRADFDFLLQPGTRHKVEEGKYDDRAPRGQNGAPPPDAEELAERDELAKLRAHAMGNAP